MSLKIIGHRGARGLAPENTLASIQIALELGVDEIEVDVRTTGDGRVVLMHDPDLKRLSGNDAIVASQPYKQLKSIKPDLTTLEEAMELIHHRVPLRIEVKPRVAIDPIVAIVQHYINSGWPISKIAYASFSQQTLLDLQKAMPDIVLVVNERWSGIRARHRAHQLHTRHIAMNERFLWSGSVQGMNRAGYKLTPYTLNDTEKAKRWERVGLYGLVTDFPDRYLSKK